MDIRTTGVAPKTYFDAVDRYAAFRRRRDQTLEPSTTAGSEVTRRIEPRTLAAQIQRVAVDYKRAQYFRRCAEEYHERWLAGRAEEIIQVVAMAQAGDKRFNRMSTTELNTVGRVRWSQSSLAHSLVGKEKRNLQWARTYLAFADFELRLALSGAGSRHLAQQRRAGRLADLPRTA